MNIKIDYNTKINHPEERIIKALKDFKSYPFWWPKKFRIKYFNKENKNTLIFSPVIGINITWQISIDGNKIKTNYAKGPVDGYGIFETNKISKNKTEVHYNIVISPRLKLIKFVPSTLIKVFKQIHIIHMKQLFKSLERHLN